VDVAKAVTVVGQSTEVTGESLVGTDIGIADAYVFNPSPPVGSLTDGLIIRFTAGNTNTGTSTLNVSSLGAKTIKKNTAQDDLAAQDILINEVVTVIFDLANDVWVLDDTGEFALNTFANGTLEFLTGNDAGRVFKIISNTIVGNVPLFTLNGQAHAEAGDSFRVIGPPPLRGDVPTLENEIFVLGDLTVNIFLKGVNSRETVLIPT